MVGPLLLLFKNILSISNIIIKNKNSGLSGRNNYEDLWFKKQIYDKI
jgi:hypothetical protein